MTRLQVSRQTLPCRKATGRTALRRAGEPAVSEAGAAFRRVERGGFPERPGLRRLLPGDRLGASAFVSNIPRLAALRRSPAPSLFASPSRPSGSGSRGITARVQRVWIDRAGAVADGRTCRWPRSRRCCRTGRSKRLVARPLPPSRCSPVRRRRRGGRSRWATCTAGCTGTDGANQGCDRATRRPSLPPRGGLEETFPSLRHHTEALAGRNTVEPALSRPSSLWLYQRSTPLLGPLAAAAGRRPADRAPVRLWPGGRQSVGWPARVAHPAVG